MRFEERGLEHGKTLLLLPGTCCTWRVNFSTVMGHFEQRYHVIAVDYDGFDGDPASEFPDMISVTEKIERYIMERHGGRVDGAYGSSLGGSFVGLLVQREHIHIDHAFIGSSDLDQAGRVGAALQTFVIGRLVYAAGHSPKKRERLINWIYPPKKDGESAGMRAFMEVWAESLASVSKATAMNQYKSDVLTPLDIPIDVPKTTFHVIYALKMGPKYEMRYRKHFRQLDLMRYDMQHEEWLFDAGSSLHGRVLADIDGRMGIA